MHSPGQHDAKYRRSLTVYCDRAFRDNFTAVILNNFLDDCEAQAGAIFLAIADERMKKPFADGFGDAWAVIGDADCN